MGSHSTKWARECRYVFGLAWEWSGRVLITGSVTPLTHCQQLLLSVFSYHTPAQVGDSRRATDLECSKGCLTCICFIARGQTGEPSRYVLQENEVLLEVQKVEPEHKSSWFIGNSVQRGKYGTRREDKTWFVVLTMDIRWCIVCDDTNRSTVHSAARVGSNSQKGDYFVVFMRVHSGKLIFFASIWLDAWIWRQIRSIRWYIFWRWSRWWWAEIQKFSPLGCCIKIVPAARTSMW